MCRKLLATSGKNICDLQHRLESFVLALDSALCNSCNSKVLKGIKTYVRQNGDVACFHSPVLFSQDWSKSCELWSVRRKESAQLRKFLTVAERNPVNGVSSFNTSCRPHFSKPSKKRMKPLQFRSLRNLPSIRRSLRRSFKSGVATFLAFGRWRMHCTERQQECLAVARPRQSPVGLRRTPTLQFGRRKGCAACNRDMS